MASITARNPGGELKAKLRVHAAQNGRSMEQEARLILQAALQTERVRPRSMGTAIHNLFEPLGRIDLEVPTREPVRENLLID